ncbi:MULTISPECIES: adenosine deaminase [Caproicibacterium]|uniref:adenosine deaminase n=1 Tax=Caproicibacterium argilliputei TaxID=3030016 RepID=A0AA97DB89_9FIRM|nr:adenosine deaminase [Caproicibacterium argilliputei]WOC33219.1 adenosine deaminase [Caproicibacterium argilliputei]
MTISFPKVELHLHLDGSLVLEDAWQMALQQGLVRQEDGFESFRRRMQVPSDCRSLSAYLQCFTLADAMLQTAPALERAAYRLLLQLSREGTAYAEIRFAPQLHCQNGLTMEQAVQAVLRGVKKAEKETDILARVLLCAMVITGQPDVDRQNERTFRIAAEYRSEGIAGVDLAGAETARPMEDFRGLFRIAQSLGLPFTIHAGEAGGPENVRLAVEFGARRIGHGCSAIRSPAVMDLLKREQITLEMCPTSNLQTGAVASLEEHPIRRFAEYGIPVTVNTDDRTCSGTTLDREYETIMRLGFRKNDLLRFNCNAAKAAFLPEKEKAALLARVEAWR